MHVRILLAKLSQQRHEASTCRWFDGPDTQAPRSTGDNFFHRLLQRACLLEQTISLFVERLPGCRKLNLFALAHKEFETQFCLQVLHMQRNSGRGIRERLGSFTKAAEAHDGLKS